MAKIYILSLLSLIVILKISYICSYIILPFNFSSNYKTDSIIDFISEPKDYFNYYMNNSIYTKIKVDDKLINFKLTMDVYSTYISDKIYIPKNEDQEIKMEKNYSLNYINLNKVKMFCDTFDFNTLDKNQSMSELNNIYKYYNYSFFKVIEYTNDTKKEDAVIGLNRIRGAPYLSIKDNNDYIGSQYEPKTNLIEQLEKKHIIDSPIFSVKYNNLKEEGEIIIGNFPHEYDKSNYLEKNLYYNKVTCPTSPPFNYYSKFIDFLYDNKTVIVPTYFQINLDHGFIEAPLKTKNIFDGFFKAYNDSCKEEILDNDVYVYYCKKDVIQNFKNITFYFQNKEIYQFGQLNDFKLEFNYNDLFININENSDIYFFQIILYEREDWIFGKPVLKKYRFVFDQDKRMYGIYTNIEKIEEKQSDKIEENNNNGFNKLIILWIVIAILGIGLIIESIYLLIKAIKKRKQRANELNDEFDYDTSLNNPEKNKIIDE